jgi:hypothetical protein
MEIDKDILLQGARRGLYRGISQGDLDLVKTSFDLLWSEREGRQAIRWSLPVYIIHTAWPLISEFINFLGHLSSGSGISVDSKDEEKYYRGFVYRLAASVKSKDAFSLALLSDDIVEAPFSPVDKERHLFRSMRKTALAFSFEVATNELFNRQMGKFAIKGMIPPDDYSINALMYCRARALSGGLFFDRMAFLAAMLLIGKRGLQKEKIRDAWRSLKIEPKPQTIPFPEMVYDDKTAFGRQVFKGLEKKLLKKGLDHTTLYTLWSRLEIDFTPKEALRIISPKKAQKADYHQSAWYFEAFKETLSFGDGVKENVMNWREKIRPMLEKEIRKHLRNVC